MKGVVADTTALGGDGEVSVAQTYQVRVTITGSAADDGKTALGTTGLGPTMAMEGKFSGGSSYDMRRL